MENISGIIIIDKPVGYTSHDVVNVVRKTFSTKKVGHTGTLDPDATGVLPICIGKATKVCDMLTFSDKEYIAKVRLGITTDTQDMSGKILKECEVNVTQKELEAAIEAHTGKLMQTPPMYSALKVNGQKLCDLARKGIEVERKQREITIYKSELISFTGDEFKIRVNCSKGTYIRTLCHDIGTFLGCGACVSELRRTASSVFSIDDAISLDSLLKLAETGDHLGRLYSVDYVFSHYKKITLKGEVKKRVLNGAASYVAIDEGTYRAYDEDGNFVCIADVAGDGKKNIMKMTKAFF